MMEIGRILTGSVDLGAPHPQQRYAMMISDHFPVVGSQQSTEPLDASDATLVSFMLRLDDPRVARAKLDDRGTSWSPPTESAITPRHAPGLQR
jgi:hypothetical protein